MGEADPSLHFLFVSFPGQGHVNPLLRLAKRVAAKGPLVTFSTTLDFGSRIRSAAQSNLPRANSDSDLIPVGLGFLRFEFFNDGSDPNDHGDLLSVLMTNLETNGPSALADLIHRQSAAGRPVSCLVNNPFIPWALDVAADLSIPSAVLWIQSCAVFSIYYHFHHRLADFPTEDNRRTVVKLPGIPPLAPDELPTFLLPSNPYKSLTVAILGQFHNIFKARWILVNSFDELEHDTFKALEDIIPIVPIGPLVDMAARGCGQDQIKADLWKSADHCLDWLETREVNSVVYVSVGSIVMLSANEMAEFAFGLRNSGRPFLWVVREDVRQLLPEGFEDAVKAEGKAMLVGWSPQEKVLASKAVGCFVTHCGWNSTLEAIAAGVPVVAYPQWGDQVPDAKFLCDVYGIGVRLSAPATREGVERSVAAAIDGEEAVRMRNRAAKWREMAREAIAVGGSSDQNMEKFFDDVRKGVAGAAARSSVD